MARRFILTIDWHANTPPFARNLRVANARLRDLDYEAPTLVVGCHRYRWSAPILNAQDVFRVLAESNAQPGYVQMWECFCFGNHIECDAGLTDCGPRRTHRNESKEWLRCYWNDEERRFYVENQPQRRPKRERTRGLRPMKKR